MALFRGCKASLSRHTTSPYPFRHHVFLSFRGEDTRKNFTDHLYTALVNAGFHTFRDDPELERGESIKEKLENAIQQSRSSVIVFSKDYTSSRWCLDELVMILERKRTSDHVVFPVYYDIGPSQLRKQAECLAEVPKYQENQSLEKLNIWRAALKEVADLAGNVLTNEADGHESKFIQKIVTVIQDKLGRVPLSDIQEVLQDKLLSVNPVLDDAEGKQLKFRKTVKPWLDQLKEAVYHAEDLLQEIKTEASRRKIEDKDDYYFIMEWSSMSKVQGLISTPSHAFDPALIYPRVEEVLDRLDSIMEWRRDVLGMESSAGYKVSQTIPSTSLVEKSVYGRDEEKKTLVKLLLSDDETGNEIGVIPIVGMGGIGKTALAQFLYNDVRVEQHFHLRAWVCVSKEFDVLRISQHIYESLTSEACQITNLDSLLKKLQKTLRGKRFLFVLDDIWTKNYDQLEFLRRPLEFGAHGSKIIVTTRDENVARQMCSLEAHRLMPLSEEDSWLLFEKHASKNVGVGAHSPLEEIGRQIVRKCNGLPLAIKSLGGVLCSKLLVEEWESILNSDVWELPLESEIMPSLWLSYMNLPSHLKHCFVHCSIFPKNYEFRTSELVYLWKAEDLLQPKKNRTTEEIGQDYFNDLISRSFFQLSSSPFETTFIMHDLINDLASFVSGEFCLRWEGSDSPNILSKTRHFSYMTNYGDDNIKIFEDLQQAKYLRTFLTNTRLSKGLDELFPTLQCLRMLNLSGNIKELPDSINNLKLLRHLDLSYSSIKKLPHTICTLYNLQVLLLSNCRGLAELPANLGRLINLSHLDITKTKLKKMPPQMGKLKDLQMLPEFVLDKHTAGDNLAELKKLEKLRGRLCISGLVHSSGLEAYILRDKKFLKELVLDWRGRDSSEEGNNTVEEREVLEKLQPHVNLERLTIEGYGGKMFADWSDYYSSSALVYLDLVDCVSCISLPPLGQLPSLKELQISGLYGVVSIGSEFYYGNGNTTTCVNKPFRSLRSLRFYDMSGLKEWSYVGGDNNEGGVFPNLVQLKVEYCPNLTGRLASDSLPSLVSLEVDDCPEFECFPEDGFPSKLKSLKINDCKIVNTRSMQNLNKGLRRLTSLEELILDFDCDEEVDWFVEEEEEGRFPSTLTYLKIYSLNFETIDGTKWFGHLNSLQELVIYNCSGLRCLPEGGLPTSLQRLEISNCPSLRCLPESGLPASLQSLIIKNCPALQCLPESGLPNSLSYLCICECPVLEKRCQTETGEDWPKIAHIKCKHINLANRQIMIRLKERQLHQARLRLLAGPILPCLDV